MEKVAVSPLSNFRSLQFQAISRGRPGFPKPLSAPPKLGLSDRGRQVSQAILASGAQLFGVISALSEGNIQNTQTNILALRSRLTHDDIVLSSQLPEPLDIPEGSILDETV